MGRQTDKVDRWMDGRMTHGQTDSAGNLTDVLSVKEINQWKSMESNFTITPQNIPANN